MKFKDANCVFYTVHREGQFASTFEEVKAVCDQNGIVKAAWYNAMRYGKPVRELNNETLENCKKYGGVPVLRLLPPSFKGVLYGIIKILTWRWHYE